MHRWVSAVAVVERVVVAHCWYDDESAAVVAVAFVVAVVALDSFGWHWALLPSHPYPRQLALPVEYPVMWASEVTECQPNREDLPVVGALAAAVAAAGH